MREFLNWIYRIDGNVFMREFALFALMFLGFLAAYAWAGAFS